MPSGRPAIAAVLQALRKTFNDALGSAVCKRRLITLPRWLLRLVVDPRLRDLLARSQRVTNQRFKQVTGWAPEVPNQTVGWRRLAAG